MVCLDRSECNHAAAVARCRRQRPKVNEQEWVTGSGIEELYWVYAVVQKTAEPHHGGPVSKVRAAGDWWVGFARPKRESVGRKRQARPRICCWRTLLPVPTCLLAVGCIHLQTRPP